MMATDIPPKSPRQRTLIILASMLLLTILGVAYLRTASDLEPAVVGGLGVAIAGLGGFESYRRFNGG